MINIIRETYMFVYKNVLRLTSEFLNYSIRHVMVQGILTLSIYSYL